MRVALATCAAVPDGIPEEQELTRRLGERGVDASFAVWSDPDVDWAQFGLVLVRSVWDYTERRSDFLAWADGISERLRNAPDLVRWNSDKRYLGEIAAAGIACVPTVFVGPGEPIPALEGEVAVKPAVSAGARDTGRFSPAAHSEATTLIGHICEGGGTAMVQPYLRGVDTVGETSLVFFAGTESHVLRKGQVLAPEEVAPLGDGPITSAAVMRDESLVGPGEATDAHRALAAQVLDFVAGRFGAMPLYARVDMLPGDDGAPVLGELEAVEPRLYLSAATGATDRLANAIVALRPPPGP